MWLKQYNLSFVFLLLFSGEIIETVAPNGIIRNRFKGDKIM